LDDHTKMQEEKKIRSNSTTLASRLPEREATSPPKCGMAFRGLDAWLKLTF
jgi:hypothetical protein